MLELLVSNIRRATDSLWIDVRYMEPFGSPTWAVFTHPLEGEPVELGRSRRKTVAIWKAWLRARALDEEG